MEIKGYRDKPNTKNTAMSAENKMRFKNWKYPEFDKKNCKTLPKIVYAGDRDIAVRVLRFIIGQGVKPIALLIPSVNKATHSQELIALCPHLDSSMLLRGDCFRKEHGKSLLKKLDIDYIISIHFPYIYSEEILRIPKHGVLNLHPAYLPYNRGWHTPTWAIWEKTPYGATLHFMDNGIDTGDIIYQKRIKILHNETADSLYKRVKKLEFEVFKEAWPFILSGRYKRRKQPKKGTFHTKYDIAKIQEIDINKRVKVEDLIRRLRALTTNKIEESAYYQVDNKTCRVQLRIVKDK